MKFACVFPGQGSQSIGMLTELAESYQLVEETFQEASDTLGYDMWQLVQKGPEATLNQTSYTQPVMLSAGVATWRCWQQAAGPNPAFMAGHSLGEYTALVCAGALGFADALSLVQYRGEAMQEAVADGSGAMAAILGLDDETVRSVCASVAQNEVVEAVNFNAPGQVVIAGDRAAVLRACEAAKEAGARRCIELPVSVPSHCALMKDAASRLETRLQETQISAPEIPVVHNVDVAAREDPDEIRAILVRQLSSPVRWVETIQHLSKQGIENIFECGPGKVLSGLNRRIDKAINSVALLGASSIEQAIASLK